MSERQETIFPRETPHDIYEMGGRTYSSLGNRHTYWFDVKGKAHVIGREAYKHRFLPPDLAGDEPLKATDSAVSSTDSVPEAPIEVSPTKAGDSADMEGAPGGLSDGTNSSVDDDMGLMGLLKAARSARQSGDTATQREKEIEARRALLKSAIRNGWTLEKARQIQEELVRIIDNDDEDSSQPVSSDMTGTDMASPVESGAVEPESNGDVVAVPVRSQLGSTRRGSSDMIYISDTAGSEAARVAEDDDPLNQRRRAAIAAIGAGLPAIGEPELVGAQDESDDESWPLYEASGDGNANGSSDWWTSTWPIAADTLNVAGGNHTPSVLGADLADLAEKAAPDLYEEYIDARKIYIDAQANARFAGLGTLIDVYAEKRGGRMVRLRDRLGERFNTRGHKRRVAEDDFTQKYIVAREAALAWYGRTAGMDDVLEHNTRMKFEIDEAKALEYDISKEKIALANNKHMMSRTVGKITGVGSAIAVGAFGAALDQITKDNFSPAFLGGAILFGGVAGYNAQRLTLDGSDAAIAARMHDAEDSVRDKYIRIHNKYSYFSNGQNKTEKALAESAFAIYATEAKTNEVQDDRLRALGGMALAGMVAAGAAYGLADTLFDKLPHHAKKPLGPDNNTVVKATYVPSTHEAPMTASTPASTVPVSTVAPTHETPIIASTPASTIPATAPASGQVGSSVGGNSTGAIVSRGGANVSEIVNKVNTIFVEGQEKVSQAAQAIRDTANDVHRIVNEAGAYVREAALQLIDVHRGNGFTDLFQQQASKLGYTLTDEKAYKMYQDAMNQFGPDRILINGNSYQMPNGDWGIRCVGPTQWAPGVEDWLIKWFQSHLAGGV